MDWMRKEKGQEVCQTLARNRRMRHAPEATTGGKGKLDTQLENGAFAGIMEEFGVLCITRKEGAIKIRSF